MSQPSAAERAYVSSLHGQMAGSRMRCIAKPHLRVSECHHPLGGFWETGKALKAHDRFVIPLSAKDLVYMGKVGTGSDRTTSAKIRKVLDTVVSAKQKVTKQIGKPKAMWVSPSLQRRTSIAT